MDDKKIIELYFARDDSAISETKTKYGKLLYSVSYNILSTYILSVIPNSEASTKALYN